MGEMGEMGNIAKNLSHGLDETLVAADWPPLEATEVDRLLAHFPALAGGGQIQWHSPRPYSAAVTVDTSVGTVFVKRYHRQVRDVAGLSEEHAFMAHLRRRGAPVCQVLAARNGQTALSEGDWTYEVHTLAPGSDLYRDVHSWAPFLKTGHAHAAGQALARFHLAAQGYMAPARSATVLVSSFHLFSAPDPLAAMARQVHSTPALLDYLSARPWQNAVRQVLLPFHHRLQSFQAQLAPLWTHNDWHGSNLLWRRSGSADEVCTIVDFGLADRTCALYDLGTAIERSIINWQGVLEHRDAHVQWAQLRALLSGYHAVCPLARIDWQALAALLPVLHAEYALSELNYFSGVLQDERAAALAYDGYFIGHAQWFAEAEGRRLLAFIAEFDPECEAAA